MEDKSIELSDEMLDKISGGIIVKDDDFYYIISDDGEETTYPIGTATAAENIALWMRRSTDVMTKDEFVAKYGHADWFERFEKYYDSLRRIG